MLFSFTIILQSVDNSGLESVTIKISPIKILAHHSSRIRNSQVGFSIQRLLKGMIIIRFSVYLKLMDSCIHRNSNYYRNNDYKKFSVYLLGGAVSKMINLI
jgi:hypothetical protein